MKLNIQLFGSKSTGGMSRAEAKVLRATLEVEIKNFASGLEYVGAHIKQLEEGTNSDSGKGMWKGPTALAWYDNAIKNYNNELILLKKLEKLYNKIDDETIRIDKIFKSKK